MTKAKSLVMILTISVIMIVLPNICQATDDITVERNIYSNNGSMKFTFSGLALDTTHEYEFGLASSSNVEAEKWHTITDYTEKTAVVDIMTTTTDLRSVINIVDTGYVTIKDKTTNTVVLKPYSVDLKIPFLRVTNYDVIPNGKDLDSNEIEVAIRNAGNSESYYQYEKITDDNIITKYNEIKSRNGDFKELESLLKTTPPDSNWRQWKYWNGYMGNENGHGYTQRNVAVPDTGLYYMWVYFSGNNIKNVYGYILVDNLEPDISLEKISLPSTEKVELGKTLTLTPIFSPQNATNKIVTWSSSDESVATIDNGGKITPKKIGSTIITVTSQDGSKKATCTVTVVESTGNNQNSGITNNGTSNSGTTNNGVQNNSDQKDTTIATGTIPKAGITTGMILMAISVIGVIIFTYYRYNKLKDIK